MLKILNHVGIYLHVHIGRKEMVVVPDCVAPGYTDLCALDYDLVGTYHLENI